MRRNLSFLKEAVCSRPVCWPHQIRQCMWCLFMLKSNPAANRDTSMHLGTISVHLPPSSHSPYHKHTGVHESLPRPICALIPPSLGCRVNVNLSASYCCLMNWLLRWLLYALLFEGLLHKSFVRLSSFAPWFYLIESMRKNSQHFYHL